jgi:phage major head subunit gpT-like protein
MIITPQAISNLFTGLKKHFQDGQSKAEPQYTKVATVVPSTTKSNTYGWLGKFPGLKKWIGDRDLKNMKAHSYSVTNEKFESSVVVSKDDIEDDNKPGTPARRNTCSLMIEMIIRAGVIHTGEDRHSTYVLVMNGRM